MIDWPMPMVPSTTSGRIALGNTCAVMMRRRE